MLAVDGDCIGKYKGGDAERIAAYSFPAFDLGGASTEYFGAADFTKARKRYGDAE